MEFDRIIRKPFNCETVDYGFIFGNGKIVFIKTGAGGSVKGYCNKHLKMVQRIHGKRFYTVKNLRKGETYD